MPHELHLHPDRLGAHAVTAAGLSEELRAALHGAPPEGFPPDPTAADEERVHAAVRRAVRDLAALGAALAGAAAEYSSADQDVARSFRQSGQRP
jgi:hypothetical protein